MSKYPVLLSCTLAPSGRGFCVPGKESLNIFCKNVENILQIQKSFVYLHTETTTKQNAKMKTYEIDYSAPAAVIKNRLTDRYAIANVYKVKYQAAFIIHYIGKVEVIFGDARQTENYCENNGLCLIPKNARARKYLSYIICK